MNLRSAIALFICTTVACASVRGRDVDDHLVADVLAVVSGPPAFSGDPIVLLDSASIMHFARGGGAELHALRLRLDQRVRLGASDADCPTSSPCLRFRVVSYERSGATSRLRISQVPVTTGGCSGSYEATFSLRFEGGVSTIERVDDVDHGSCGAPPPGKPPSQAAQRIGDSRLPRYY